MTVMLTEGDHDRGRSPDVAARAPQRWYRTETIARELPPEFCVRGHRPRFLQGWEPGQGRYYACQVPTCDSVQYRY